MCLSRQVDLDFLSMHRQCKDRTIHKHVDTKCNPYMEPDRRIVELRKSVYASFTTKHAKGDLLLHSIGTASANSAKFRGIRPRMYIEDLL